MVEAMLHAAIAWLNSLFWGYVLVYLLLGVGLFFTLRFGFIQFRALGRSAPWTDAVPGPGITGFQAFATGVASRVGTGNIAGVAIALSLGGPGAIFWMWVVAILGMASAFVEATLAQIFKVRDSKQAFRGGPSYYIQLGLGSRLFGVIFALALILAFGLVFNAVQAQAIAEVAHTAFGFERQWVGAGLVLLVAPVIFGGMRRVARLASVVVPVMALGYLLATAYIIAMNLGELPGVLALIVRSAFGLEPAAGGVAGYAVSMALMTGVKRGLFSNEAGMGSAPNAAAAASTSHPVSQGLLQMFGVVVDTLLICSATAFIILLSGVYQPGDAMQGATLTHAAVTAHLGDAGSLFLAIAIFFLAYSSVIGNYAYAESNVQFICKHPLLLLLFRCGVLGMVMFGSVGSLPLVWEMADTSMALMATINLIAIVLLSKYAYAAWRDYQAQRRRGIDKPVFTRAVIPALAERLPKDVW